MRRADRLFELIHLLRRARQAMTAAQLAEALEVTPRTIYRDVAALMAMRVPIDGAAGVGYIMRPGYDLPPLMFDREEVEAVAVGLQLLNRTGDRDLQVAARRVAAKIADVLPDLRANELDDGRFVVSGFGAPSAADMGMLRSAVRDRVGRVAEPGRAPAHDAREGVDLEHLAVPPGAGQPAAIERIAHPAGRGGLGDEDRGALRIRCGQARREAGLGHHVGDEVGVDRARGPGRGLGGVLYERSTR